MTNRDRQKQEILSKLQTDSRVQSMEEFTQHGNTNTFEHCKQVADCSYKIDSFLSAKSDLKVLLTGAMLHDFFLYDWHEDDGSAGLHGFTHAAIASDNAKKYFNVDEKTSHVIQSHMWPLNITNIPRTREAWIVCMADKYVSLRETLFRR